MLFEDFRLDSDYTFLYTRITTTYALYMHGYIVYVYIDIYIYLYIYVYVYTYVFMST